MMIMQGDAYPVFLNLSCGDTPLTPDLVEEIEITFGRIRKTLSDGEVWFDPVEQQWYFDLVQKETLILPQGSLTACCRVKFTGDDVKGIVIKERVMVLPSCSREVL